MKKFESIVRGLSFGEQYLVASIIYLGLSLMLIASMPEMKMAFASGGGCSHEMPLYYEGVLVGYETVSGCPDGQMCCGDSCINVGQGCCNGTPYDTATSGCCFGNVYNKETQDCCCSGIATKDECCCEYPECCPQE